MYSRCTGCVCGYTIYIYTLRKIALYGTVPPFWDPGIPIDCICIGYLYHDTPRKWRLWMRLAFLASQSPT